jgi:hypothetical protein
MGLPLITWTGLWGQGHFRMRVLPFSAFNVVAFVRLSSAPSDKYVQHNCPIPIDLRFGLT